MPNLARQLLLPDGGNVGTWRRPDDETDKHSDDVGRSGARSAGSRTRIAQHGAIGRAFHPNAVSSEMMMPAT